MADVVEAPVVKLDGDDWLEFNDCRPGSPPGDVGKQPTVDRRSIEAIVGDQNRSSESREARDGETVVVPGWSVVLTADGAFSSSLGKMFPGVDGSGAAEVPIEGQERTVNDSEVWKQLSNRFQSVQLVTWPESLACQLQKNSLELKDILENNGMHSADDLDLSEDEELQQCMDLHGLILTSEFEVQPIKTADEIISEIEEMMDDEIEAEKVTVMIDGPSKTAEIIRTKLKQTMPPGTTMIECLKNMSTPDLETLHCDLETTVRDYSEVLVQELALREELDYQKELNNQFISLLLGIHRRRRELDAERKKAKMLSSKQKEPTSVYLTTVIPYDDHLGPPDTDRLQIYLKIMTAIEEDSGSVPALLTDYILKVLCPTT